MDFSTPTTAKLVGVTVRQLRYWSQKGLLKPSAKSTGHKRYTFRDIVALKTVRALRSGGASIQQIRKSVDHLRKHYPKEDSSYVLTSLTLLTDGNNVYLLHDANQIQEVLTKQIYFMVVALGTLIEETTKQIDELPSEWQENVTVQGRRYTLDMTRDPATDTYTAQCRELPGAIEQGETPMEAVENGKAAIESVVAFMLKRQQLRARSVKLG
jgi:DNA-binding transcriptional MerR regulator